MDKVIWLMQLSCIWIFLANGSKIDLDSTINYHVEEIIKSSFENISKSLYNDKLRSSTKVQGVNVLSHGMNRPNAQTMQLSCIWDSMKHAAARIQKEVPGAKQMASLVGGAEVVLPTLATSGWNAPAGAQQLSSMVGGAEAIKIPGTVQQLCTQFSRSMCGSDHLKTLSCNPNNPYRTVDGTCNNLHNHRWGSAPRAFERYLQADYADRVSSPRTGSRKPLPNPRVVSNTMASAENERQKSDISIMFMQWGQFLNHDITLTPARPSDAVKCSLPFRPRGNECFYIHEDPSETLNWDAAKQRCLDMRGYLAQPQDMNDFINHLKESYPNSKNQIWLGGSDREVEGQWKWVSGESVPSSLWVGTPWNQPSGDGDCMELHYTESTNLYLNDVRCNNKAHFACEIGNDNSNYNCDNESNQCCAPEDEDCISIDVRQDPYFSKFKVDCLPMSRSMPAAKGCSFEEMEQVNQNTAFIDASNVYGSSDDVASFVRTKSGGRLNITENESTGKPMPPLGGVFGAPACPIPEADGKCFLAGDTRIDMVPGLIVLHTAFIRLHNNLADELVRINKHWDDEKVYQETRRIVGALAQQITYRDWLPILLGPTVMAEYNLNVGYYGYRDSYQQYVDPTVKNVFSAAAYRFGHTMPGDTLKMASAVNDYPQAGHFFNTSVLQNAETGPSSMLKGMARCPMEAVDPVVGSALRNEIFAFPAGSGTGSDLVATNVMRGRDHGIPAYSAWREWCGLKPVKTLNKLKKVMDKRIANKLNEIYRGEIKDIDLYAGGLAEHSITDGLLGPTFSCILGRQFSQLKHGDRFWYERKGQPKPFTPGQLSAIRQTSLASIVCNVTGGSKYAFQPNPFRTTDDFGNNVMECENFAFINLEPWREAAYDC